MPQWITRVVSPLELPQITADYARLHRITQVPRISPIYLDCSGLLQFTSDYCGLLRITRITPDYQFRSPSGPVDYQSGFSLGITVDYLDYPGLYGFRGLL